MKDPFVHLPRLRDRICDPVGSPARNIDLAALDEKMRNAGASADWRHSDEFREASRSKAMAGRNHEDLWVFAYGSLMWDPAFHFEEVRSATLQGYQRRFCLRTVLGRGTPEQPGLMAGLDVGGICHGLAFRIRREQLEDETRIIWRREMLLHAYQPALLPVDTGQGNVEALAFVVDHSAASYLPDLSFEQTARCLGSGVGVLGSNLEYVENLVEHFVVLGIEDAELFALRDRAREIAGGCTMDKGAV